MPDATMTLLSDADVTDEERSKLALPPPPMLPTQQQQRRVGSLEERSSDASLDIASIPPPALLQDDSLEGTGETMEEEEGEETTPPRPRPLPRPPPRALSRISEGSCSRQLGSSGGNDFYADSATRFLLATYALAMPKQNRTINVNGTCLSVTLPTLLAIPSAEFLRWS